MGFGTHKGKVGTVADKSKILTGVTLGWECRYMPENADSCLTDVNTVHGL